MLTEAEIKKIYKEHQTSADGLSDTEIQKRKEKYGKNAIVAKKKKPLILVFLEEFKDLMVIILIIAAILALIAGEITDGSVIIFVVILNATIGFIQKYKAGKAIEALKKLIAPRARVIRNGTQQEIDAKEIVPGDILILQEGDSITADAILIESNALEAMESALTGESMPVQKLTTDLKETKGLESEKENIVFMGTNITHGNGKAIVIKIGMQTQMGLIAKLTTETKSEKSPLEKELHRIGVFVGKVAVGIAATLVIYGVFIQGKEFIETLLFGTSVAVAAVPEGLPATITIALAIGVQRLAKKNAIVKQLSAAETLGSTTVICSDKTGTLTKNEMTVKEIYFGEHQASVHGVGYKPSGYINIQKNGQDLISIGKEQGPYEDYEITQKDLEFVAKKDPKLYESLKWIMTAATLCNNASLTNNNNKWSVLGDPTEGALLTLSTKCGFKKEHLEAEMTKIFEISFDSTRKLMTVVVKTDDGKYYALTKGAPDSILPICKTHIQSGKNLQLIKSAKEKYHTMNEEMASRALRVLAFAYKELTEKEIKEFKKTNSLQKEKIEKELTFLGLVGMIDPPRPEVQNAVDLARKAHIRIYIITGDHGLTATAIAKQLTIVTEYREHKVITGIELNKLSDKNLLKDLSNKNLDIIFARVSPEHKLRIVSLLKKLNEIVAVTGDGVNDAPALKKADIGIAMGITGTDVSKEAANMVLADDSFSSIIAAIKEGRTIYNNLKKFVFYMFSCNIGELITVFAAIAIALPTPLSAILILAINLGTDVLPAVALGVEPPEEGIMNQKPRNPEEKIMNKQFILRYVYVGTAIGIIVMTIYILNLYRYGWTWGTDLSGSDPIHLRASTTAFALLIVIQMMQAFNARSQIQSIFKIGLFSNKYLVGAIAISLIMTFAMVEMPFFQHYLHTTALSLTDWIIIIGSASIIIFMEEIRKLLARKKIAIQQKET